jgi:hypothetical protein
MLNLCSEPVAQDLDRFSLRLDLVKAMYATTHG